LNLAKKIIHVQGMSCAACVARVERGIKDLEGVQDAAVNLATSKATVEYDPELVNESAIRQKIEEIGYEPLDLDSAKSQL
jgi:Cu+-exporting ATPase